MSAPEAAASPGSSPLLWPSPISFPPGLLLPHPAGGKRNDAAGFASRYGPSGCTPRLRDRFSAQTEGAARGLQAEPEFAAAVDRLPFSAGQTLAVIGESTTDAADSWLEILGHLIGLRRPGDAISLVNAAISGYPTTMLSAPASRAGLPPLAGRQPLGPVRGPGAAS
jgi:hypothetical protein